MKKNGVRSYRDLIVWQKAMDLVVRLYQITKNFPKEEQYGLSLQLRKCGTLIPSNIAEGFGRNSSQDFIRFLQIATGSLYEAQTQLEAACRLKYVSEQPFAETYELSREIERMLGSLIRSIKASRHTITATTIS